MSRIGRKPLAIPSGVTFEVKPEAVIVKGSKGELTVPLFPGITINIEGEQLTVERKGEDKQIKAWHGLVRSLINNSIIGVTAGYKKTLKLVGTGYRVTMKGTGLNLSLGFSHPVDVTPLPGVKLTVEGNDTIYVEGFDKQVVGEMAASIRKLRPPEPYKGKGIRYVDEVVRRKQGKTAA